MKPAKAGCTWSIPLFASCLEGRNNAWPNLLRWTEKDFFNLEYNWRVKNLFKWNSISIQILIQKNLDVTFKKNRHVLVNPYPWLLLVNPYPWLFETVEWQSPRSLSKNGRILTHPLWHHIRHSVELFCCEVEMWGEQQEVTKVNIWNTQLISGREISTI